MGGQEVNGEDRVVTQPITRLCRTVQSILVLKLGFSRSPDPGLFRKIQKIFSDSDRNRFLGP
jgi:hypothetical protein